MGLDETSTMDASRAGEVERRRPVVRIVFSGAEGVTSGCPRVLPPGPWVVGRSVAPGEGLSLELDGRASRRHAAFEHDPRRGTVVLRDLGSRNGTWVNGEPITEHALVDGDWFHLGSTFGVFREEDPHQIDVPHPTLLGPSAAMAAVRVAVKRLARVDATVLVTGETGTGKEIVAQALHDASGRSGRFVAVNCTAIAESLAESELFGHVAGSFTGARNDHDGYLRAADRGTLLLDEIGDMPLTLQPKLLRALETSTVVPVGDTTPRAFDARIVAATHRDLDAMVGEEAFREDLLARLAQLRITIPPLRERREDVLVLLARHLGASPPLAPSLVEALLRHSWPRNAREVIAIATELKVWGGDAERLELEHVRHQLAAVPSTTSPRRSREAVDSGAEEPVTRERLTELLRLNAGNVTAVARAVGRSRTQVYRLFEQHQLDPTSFR